MRHPSTKTQTTWIDRGPWAARHNPYMDYTSSNPPSMVDIAKQTGLDAVMAAFVLATSTSPPTPLIPNFGNTDLSKFSQNGGKVILSFGGQNGVYLEQAATSADQLASLYTQVIKYVTSNCGVALYAIDLDFESQLIDIPPSQRDPMWTQHFTALPQVLADFPDLNISYTLGLDEAAGYPQNQLDFITGIFKAQIVPGLFNGMAMHFGDWRASFPIEPDCENAITQMATQIANSNIYGSYFQNPQDVWRRVGATVDWYGEPKQHWTPSAYQTYCQWMAGNKAPGRNSTTDTGGPSGALSGWALGFDKDSGYQYTRLLMQYFNPPSAHGTP